MLLQQRGGFAFLLGRVVLDLGLLLFADLGGDQAVGQAHVHPMHCRTCRAGEHVLGLDGALAFVLVGLHHGHVGNHAADLHIHLGGLERQLVHAGVVAFDEEIGALGFEAGCGVTILRVGGVGYQCDKAQHCCGAGG